MYIYTLYKNFVVYLYYFDQKLLNCNKLQKTSNRKNIIYQELF